MELIKKIWTINVLLMPAGHAYLTGNHEVISEILSKVKTDCIQSMPNKRVLLVEDFHKGLLDEIKSEVFNDALKFHCRKKIDHSKDPHQFFNRGSSRILY